MQVRSVLVATTLYLNNIYESLSIDNTLSNLLATDYKDSKEALNEIQSIVCLHRSLVRHCLLSTSPHGMGSGWISGQNWIH